MEFEIWKHPVHGGEIKVMVSYLAQSWASMDGYKPKPDVVEETVKTPKKRGAK